MKTIKQIIVLAFLWLCLYACTTPDVVFDGTPRVYFMKDSIRYSFGAKPFSLTTDTVRVPIRIIGTPVTSNRKITVQIDSKRSTATSGKEYKDFNGECTLFADSINAYIPIIMYREALAKDSVYRLFLSLSPNTDFELGIEESLKAIVFFNNILEKPEWWNGAEYYLGIYQSEKYQKFIELNGGKELVSEDDFNQKYLYYLKILYNVKLFFDAHPEYKVNFPKEAKWPF